MSSEELTKTLENLREIRGFRPEKPFSKTKEELYSPIIKNLKLDQKFLDEFFKEL